MVRGLLLDIKRRGLGIELKMDVVHMYTTKTKTANALSGSCLPLVFKVGFRSSSPSKGGILDISGI
jgi:hypothetical protein